MRQVLLIAAWGMGWAALTAGGGEGNYASRIAGYETIPSPPTPLTNSAVVLGEPSRWTDDPHPEWGGVWPVDPFGGPYLQSQILQLDAGASLTVEMQRPVWDDPEHPYGLDFLVFGNAFLQLNGDWTTTSGLLGGRNEGSTRVSVSADGQTFYALMPDRAAVIDSWFPTDGEGDFGVPVDPALRGEDFAGADLSGVRQRYGGSGGGTGFDLGWAVDEQGGAVHCPWIRYVRFEQMDGPAQLDAVSGVAPRPILFEDFKDAPAEEGWRVHGDAALFEWNAAAGYLDVTWDSSRSNSYFHRPLNTVLSRVDDFVLSFDLRLDSIVPGFTEGKPAAFQLALGLVEFDSAVRPGFFRGTGMNAESGPRNVLEFDYFPDAGFGATLSPVLVSSNNQFAVEFDFPVELPVGQWITVVLDYSPSDGVIRSRILSDGQVFYTLSPVTLDAEFTDFRFDTIAICSYSDAGQNPQFAQGSVLAHGAVDNVMVVLPDAPLDLIEGGWSEGGWIADISTQPGWVYELERTFDFQTWTVVETHHAVLSGKHRFSDSAPDLTRAFYRVRATKP